MHIDQKARSFQLAAFAGVALASMLAVAPAEADEAGGLYGRGELGISISGQDRGYWQSGSGDPRITFSLDQGLAVSGALGAGYDWGNGVRADASLNILGPLNVNAAFLSASDGSPAAGHVTTLSTSVSSVALMGNLFIEPMRLAGHDGNIQPFLTAGLGVARVSMGDWTRLNPTPPARASRTFAGASQINFAWTVGAGVSVALTDVLGTSGFLDIGYRYTNLGNVAGSSTPNPGSGASNPVEAFNLNLVTHAVTVGLRMPLGR